MFCDVLEYIIEQASSSLTWKLVLIFPILRWDEES